MDFRKTYFLLPNLFTLAGLFCGFYAIAVCARLNDEGVGSDALYKASLAIFIGMFFDTADGRIARLTKTQSELGLHLDSLADVVTFGVAPGFVVYRWGLEGLGQLGLFVAFVFVACGALRLARFNVLSLRAQKDEPEKPSKYMLGLPIPVAATVIISLVMGFHAIGISQTTNHVLVGVMIAVVMELCGIASLPFAVGAYLPLSTSVPIFVGGIVRWLVDRARKSKGDDDFSPGTLLSSGYIAGGAIAGIIIAFVAGVFDQLDAKLAKAAEANPFFAGPNADALAMLPFAAITLLLLLVGLEKWLAGPKRAN